MSRNAFLLCCLLLVLLMVGCGPTPMSVQSVVTEIRPDVVYYVHEWGASPNAAVWGNGPVNATAVLHGNVGGQPERVRVQQRPLERMDAGASFLGSYGHTPQVGDSIVCALLPYAPAVDSLGATSGSAVLTCSQPDTLDLRVVVYVPSGAKYGPDTLKTWARLIRVP